MVPEAFVRVLGVTADDKGAQLEALVRSVLEQQGYKKIRSNVVGSGGNELDVVAVRESAVVGDVQVTPLLCEAKAYADSVNMPTWQKFLGKLFIERSKNATSVGMLVALNGVNGNVAGSFDSLRATDSALFVFEGADLVDLATKAGELSAESDAVQAVESQFHASPLRAEVAYYGGVFYRVVWWKDDEYSVVDGHGQMFPTENVERLRPALEGSLSGTLLASDEARAEAEARHHARLRVMNRLFRGEEVLATEVGDLEDGSGGAKLAGAVAMLVEEPFCRVEDGRLVLIAAAELDARAVSRLFLSLFEDTVEVAQLSFMVEGHHEPYFVRLVEVLPDTQAGFALADDEMATLRAVGVLFPSVWVTIARPIQMITTHRSEDDEVVDEAILASDRGAFWETVIEGIKTDFANPRLRGFLYDHMGVAELEERGEFVVKSKKGSVGQPIKTELRNAVRQWGGEPMGEVEGPIYVMVRILPTVAQPWDEEHPAPEFPLDDEGTSGS